MGLRRENNVIFTNKATATGIGQTINASDFRNLTFGVATNGGGNANLTIKFQGSIQKEQPNFGLAQSDTNLWDYIEVLDLNTGVAITGDTGFSVAVADAYKQFSANIDGVKWVNVEVTAITAGDITVTGYLFSND